MRIQVKREHCNNQQCEETSWVSCDKTMFPGTTVFEEYPIVENRFHRVYNFPFVFTLVFWLCTFVRLCDVYD